MGIFEFRTKSSKRRLENEGGGSEIVINVAHDTKNVKGADPYEERDEHEGKHEGNTRGTREK